MARRMALEVADIFRVHGAAYREARRVSPADGAVMRHIVSCRTRALGGHLDFCDACGPIRISYNSCRDRHCPKCQNLERARWLEARRDRLLPVPYFHVVAAPPHDLNGITLQNREVVYDILFRSVSETLLTIAADPKHLGAQIGFTAILHTWGQDLRFHPHLHCVVTGGGLSRDGTRWIAARKTFFLAVKVLAKMFRGKFLAYLREAYDEGRLVFRGKTAALGDSVAFRHLIGTLYRKKWVTYAKAPFGGAEHVFRYLGRYSHRVAISNGRLLAMEDGRVRFEMKDYKDGERRKVEDLPALEFIRRFLLHRLPKRYTRIRHYGLLAGRNVRAKLEVARRLLGSPPRTNPRPERPKRTWAERYFDLTGIDIMACPRCGRPLVRRPLPEPDTPQDHVKVSA
jgi:hypothetical protein